MLIVSLARATPSQNGEGYSHVAMIRLSSYSQICHDQSDSCMFFVDSTRHGAHLATQYIFVDINLSVAA